MRAIAAIVLATLASTALLVACGPSQRQQGQQGQVSRPHLRTLGLSGVERIWFERLGLKPSAPEATGTSKGVLVRSILLAAYKPGVDIVSLEIYTSPDLAPGLAPALKLAVARPAYFLRHQLAPILSALITKSEAYYIRIVDSRARPVLEWRENPERGRYPAEGSVYVKPGLESCGPVNVLGSEAKRPLCPVK